MEGRVDCVFQPDEVNWFGTTVIDLTRNPRGPVRVVVKLDDEIAWTMGGSNSVRRGDNFVINWSSHLSVMA